MQPSSNDLLDGSIENPSPMRRSSKTLPKGEWRDKLSFWIFGLTHKFSYVLILTAAHDITHCLVPNLKLVSPPRHSCFFVSSGVILLAIVGPAHPLLFILPRLPYNFTFYLTTGYLLNIASLLTIALAKSFYVAFIGVAVGSLGFRFTDFALSTQIVHYRRSIIKLFTSVNNFSCICSSFYYAGLRELKVDFAIAFYSVIPLHILAMIAGGFLLRPAKKLSTVLDLPPEDSEFPLSLFNLKPPIKKLEDKCMYICQLMRYIVPLGLIVFMQNFINHGLYEFVYFSKEFLLVESQYRWLNFMYQLGFYACVTTKTLLVLRYIWIYTVIQFLLMCFFILDALFFIAKYLWIVLLLAYLEGIFCGAAYVNTIDRMEIQELATRMEFAELVIKHSMSMLTILAGILAILTYYFLCQTIEPIYR